MATAVKTLRTLVAAGTTCVPSTPQSGSWDLHTALGGILTALITNGGTGPTVGCILTVNISGDNTNWKQFAQVQAGTTAGAAYPYVFKFPRDVMYAQAVFSGNTGQNVTVEAFGQELTSEG